MINNCVIQYDVFENGIFIRSFTEEFFDPFIYNIDGKCYFWNGGEWCFGTSYGGTPILKNLKKINPKNKYDSSQIKKI